MRYEPDQTPPPAEWLALDESERIARVESWHSRNDMQLPGPRARLHATIHVVVENQIAAGDAVVIEAIERLRGEGLTRHDAIHAVGSVVAEQMFEVLKRLTPPGTDPNEKYHSRVRSLTAAKWRQSGT